MPQTTPQAPSTPAPGGPAQPVTAPASPSGTAAQRYQGARTAREVLTNQKERLQEERERLQQELREGPASPADKAGLEQQLAQVDQAIAKISIDIEEANRVVAQLAAVPGALESPRRDPWVNGPPVELVATGMALGAVLLFPIALAYARRLWRRASVVSAVPPELTDRIAQMERNLDAVAVEIERIGEGQRFVTQLLGSRQDRAAAALPDMAGPGADAPLAPRR